MSEQMEAFADLSVEIGQKLNVDLIIARAISNIENQIRFSQNKIDINKQWHSKMIELIVVVDDNRLSTSQFTPTSNKDVKDQVETAVKFTHKMAASPFFQGIEEKISNYPNQEWLADADIHDYRDKAPNDVNDCIDTAISAGAVRVSGSYLFGDKTLYLKSSEGPSGSYSETYYNFTVRAFQDDLDASGQGLACGRIPFNAKKEILAAGERAGHFSKLHQGAKQVKRGKYDIIMTPAVAANLLGTIPAMANPLAIVMGRSALEDKMGDKLSSEFVSISDNGLQQDGLRSSPFDIEGTPRQITPIFEDGVLINHIHNTSTAQMAGGTSTGNGNLIDWGIGAKFFGPSPTNLVFNNGDHSFEELLEGSSPAVFVTCNWYTRFTSIISTEYSTIPRDAAFIVENGELNQPIKNFRISDNLLRQFANIEAMGNDQVQVKWWEIINPTWIGSVRVKDCRVTTATQ
ncbi:MAG: TldD/PmbA family protein [Candidatus Hodarchaeales archaeon]|jgi:PmbA protein